eukprot:Hpha_TRINITY_DN16895_c1_g1::TRINITY_DN16895_c1_g1_i18::g.151577::m.151577
MLRSAAAARVLLVQCRHATHSPAHAARVRQEPAQRPRGPPRPQRQSGSIVERLISGELSAAEMQQACTRSRLEELCPDSRFVPRDGRSGRKHERALAMIAEAVVRREGELHALGPEQLRRLVHGYAKARQRAPRLFTAVASAAVGKVGEFSPQNLTLTVWAYAKSKQKATVLFDAVTKEAETRARTFDPQSLSNTVWAYATLQYNADAPFAAVATAVEVRISELNPQCYSTQ